MYEELVERLRSHNGWALNKTLDEAADAIEKLEKKLYFQDITTAQILDMYMPFFIPKWIPVTELLPVRDVPVLVCLFGHSPYIAWISHEGEWKTDDCIIDSDYLPQVWMPLPVPPKEET